MPVGALMTAQLNDEVRKDLHPTQTRTASSSIRRRTALTRHL